MPTLLADQALLQDGWAQNVAVHIGADGRITGIDCDAAPAGTQRVAALMPAPANSHSHAFQRAMAGLSERRGPGADSFWTWRSLMYRFLDSITPEQVQAIAAFVQMQMLEAGFATNVEFHYLHHRPDGASYDDVAEMSARIAAAAEQSGIGLTLLPVLYRFGGCDGRALAGGQLRFGNDLDRFARLVEGAGRAVARLPDARLGLAPHSLRAVARDDFAALAQLGGNADGPIHMHLAEQLPEVNEVQAAYGARPVEWALDNLDLSPRWCLIHLTQMLPHETARLAATGAVAGLCPLTEASLGDGIFDGVNWMAQSGAISIGSDSNIRISLAEELRQLDTSQRLRDHSRAALATDQLSTGRRIFDAAARGGAQAAGRGAGVIAPGEWADLLALDMTHPDLAGLTGDTILDSFAFAGGNEMIADVWAAGRHMVQGGRHVTHDAITGAYNAAVRDLRQSV